MYARNLSDFLHRELSDIRDYTLTMQRFESLRGYGMLPRGRENAGKRLDDQEIAAAIFGFVPTQAGWAGHTALLMANFKPVGGIAASFCNAPTLGEALGALVGTPDAHKSFVSLTLSIVRNQHDQEYFGQLRYKADGSNRVASYTTSDAVSLSMEGAEETFDENEEVMSSARQLVLGPHFVRDLSREVATSRYLNLPLKTDWTEFENEEQKQDFHKRMGARNSSRFFNIGVDTQATWPREPTRVKFAGHHFVLFPKTHENSHSISVDLANEHLTHQQARTLINRLLSLLSWCDNQHAILRDGWSGNPVPVPVPKRNLAFATTHHWIFNRSIPDNEELLRCLAYYREGLNAGEAGLETFSVLSFYKVFEVRYATGDRVKHWVANTFDLATSNVFPEALARFHADRGTIAIDEYVYRNCRVATAHAAKDIPSDADASQEIRRLANAAPILQALARHFIQTEFQFAVSYYVNDPDQQ
jgi:hypothetical protein